MTSVDLVPRAVTTVRGDRAAIRAAGRTGQAGFLAIWSDVSPERETDYLHWLTREHAEERLSIPGFAAVRVFRARAAHLRRYFILYDLDAPEVVGSAAYLARLDDPTPWSRRIMPSLANFARGGGRRLFRTGHGSGGIIAAATIGASAIDDALALADKLVVRDRVAAVQVLAVDRASSEIETNEKAIRAGDRSFDGLLVVEALDEGALGHALASCPPDVAGDEPPLFYDQVFSLRAGDLG